jgi:hypothetical protein
MLIRQRALPTKAAGMMASRSPAARIRRWVAVRDPAAGRQVPSYLLALLVLLVLLTLFIVLSDSDECRG